MKLRKNNIIKETDKVVCIVTGTGLRDPKIVLTNGKQPLRILKDVDRLLYITNNTLRSQYVGRKITHF